MLYKTSRRILSSTRRTTTSSKNQQYVNGTIVEIVWKTIFHQRLTACINKILLRIQYIRVIRQCDLHMIHWVQLDVHIEISFIRSLVGKRLEETHCCLSNDKKEKIITEYLIVLWYKHRKYSKLKICENTVKIVFQSKYKCSNSTSKIYTTFETK